MSSKAAGPQQQQVQQQGRRTPLSLTGSKAHHQNNKTHQNSAKSQELKDSQANKNHANNGNNNATAAKHQDSSQNKDDNSKKNHQNGNKVNANSDNNQGKKSNEKNDVVIVEQNGNANGNGNNTSNGQVSNGKIAKQTAKEAKGKEKEIKEKEAKEKETENDKEIKSGNSNSTAATKQNETTEKPIAQVQPTKNSSNLTGKEDKSIPIDIPANTISDTPQNQATPPKANANNVNQKTPTTKSTSNAKSSTPSKSSPRGATSRAPIESIEIADEEMLPLVAEQSPVKKLSTLVAHEPAATSTPGKLVFGKASLVPNSKSEMPLTAENLGAFDRKSVPRTFCDISGRRSIRSIGDYTPGKYSTQFRESYRRINTELDVTSNTNTSMNVTVGSEIPNNSSFLSFSIFGRGRKRERTPPPSSALNSEKSQSAVELTTTETTPPKRARLDMHGIFNVMASPLTLLRTRFSKATIETPSKQNEQHDEEHKAKSDDDVQNVSGISIDEVASSEENTGSEDLTVGKEAIETKNESSSSKNSSAKDKAEDANTTPKDHVVENTDKAKSSMGAMDVDGEVVKETPIVAAVGDPKIKQKGCCVM